MANDADATQAFGLVKSPELLKALEETKNPEARAMLERLFEAQVECQAKASAQDLHQAAEAASGAPVQSWLPICPMPTDLCRVSPFFPMDKGSLNPREYLEELVITETSWGRISYTGPRLSTYEEDVLMAVLALLDDKANRKEAIVNGVKTYTYQGPLLPVLRMMGLTGHGKNYARIKASLRRLTTTALDLEIFKRGKAGQRKVAKSEMTSILARARWEDETQELTVTVNPFFFETYIQGSITRLDVMRRAELGSPIAKSLYRFMQSHRDDRWQGHFLTLAAALNLDENLPHFKKRDRIRAAIRRLIDAKLLTKQSGFKKDSPDVVVLVRPKGATGASPGALPGPR